MSHPIGTGGGEPGARRRPWQRLDLRIVALFLALLLAVQGVCWLVVRHSVDANAERQIAAELHTGEALLRRLLAQDEQKLTEAARLLAADYGFRAAIASADLPTIVDALDNQGARIGAAAALFTDPHQRLVGATVADGDRLVPLVQANLRPAARPDDTRVRIVGGSPYQLVTVPVRTPQLIGHVSMGFPLTPRLAEDLTRLSPLKLALVTRPAGGASWAALPIGDAGQALAGQPIAVAPQDAAAITLGGERHRSLLVPLAEAGGVEVAALLLRSVDQALVPYRELQWTLLLITAGGVAIFGFGSVATARRITRPLALLSRSAERLGEGDYSMAVPAGAADEVGELARSFEAMRQAMRQREGQIRRLAYWDALTGLPNREQLRQAVAERLATALAGGEPCTVLMLDLDRFKHVNDVLGHAFGDRVLHQVAQRLSGGLLRDADLVARWSGDEFACLLPGADTTTALAVAQRIRSALERPLTLDEQTVDVGAGIGIATGPDHAADADALLGRAEIAMYAAKDRRAGIVVYEPALDGASASSLSLLGELRAAAERDEFRLFLQPKIALASGRVLGAEALVRWQHPTRGLLSPAQFIPFAEQTGFVRVLTAWMVARSAASVSTLRSLDQALRIAVNLSTRDLLDQDLPAKFERQLRASGAGADALTLEITESAIMDDPERALATLAQLRERGFKLSIDDFGTGYSSLAYLKRLPLDELKIDRSFVMSMAADPADLKIVRSTIDLAHNLGLAVVAEGIEGADTLATLAALGCDEGQGYFIARPMPEAAFDGWLRARLAAAQPTPPLQGSPAPAAELVP